MIVICCLKIVNCDTGTIVWINIGPEGSPTYNTWDAEVGNSFTTTDPVLTGTWIVDSICCSGACPDYTANCQVGAIVTDVASVTFGASGCPSTYIILVNCQDASTLFVGGIDLSYDGSVITIAEYPGCWQMSLGIGFITTEPVTFLNAFGIDGCTCCLGESYPPPPDPFPVPGSSPETLPLPYSETTPLSPRLFYQVTQGECDINANIKFANGYYKLFLGLKNGYGNCCDTIDLDKLWIKKEQSDYSVMTDPNACSAPTEVVPIICPEPS
jgi:hypothetical protein